MAHFAKLDTNNIVEQVIVVANRDTSTPDGTEIEAIGIAFCQRMFGGKWVQTSYNGSFRKNYAGIGFKYDSILDAFIPPKPFPSWILNETSAKWEAPTPRPDDDQMYSWNESSQQWTLVE